MIYATGLVFRLGASRSTERDACIFFLRLTLFLYKMVVCAKIIQPHAAPYTLSNNIYAVGLRKYNCKLFLHADSLFFATSVFEPVWGP